MQTARKQKIISLSRNGQRWLGTDWQHGSKLSSHLSTAPVPAPSDGFRGPTNRDMLLSEAAPQPHQSQSKQHLWCQKLLQLTLRHICNTCTSSLSS